MPGTHPVYFGNLGIHLSNILPSRLGQEISGALCTRSYVQWIWLFGFCWKRMKRLLNRLPYLHKEKPSDSMGYDNT